MYVKIIVGEHITSGFSMSTISSFKDYMKMFCKSLRENAMEITNFH